MGTLQEDAGLIRVETGNGEGDIWRDEQGRAYWSSGYKVTLEDCYEVDDADVLRDVIRRNGLTVVQKIDVTLPLEGEYDGPGD